MMKKGMMILAWLLAVVACQSGRQGQAGEVLPEAPDYGDTTQWYVTDRQGEADIFYIISTETGDYTLDDGITRHHADTYNDSLRQPLYSEMLGVDTLLSGRLNFYSPYYRQCSIQTFAEDSLTAQQRFATSLDDVRRAFAYYLKYLNQGRPFILAGFSQGAMILVELLKEMDEVIYQRMIAAYAIGISIPQETVNQNPHIVAAKGADDTGVTICYNSVRDVACAMHGKSALAINPVNWRTDAQPANWMTEPSPLLPVSEQKKDTLTARLDVESGLLLVNGYTATDYMIPVIGKEGNYHSREIWLYRQQLRDNMAQRANNYLKK